MINVARTTNVARLNAKILTAILSMISIFTISPFKSALQALGPWAELKGGPEALREVRYR